MGCVFCAIVTGDVPSWQVYEDADCLAFLDIGQATLGHTVVVPKEHTPDLLAATPDQAAAVMRASQAVARLLDEQLRPAGVSIVQSNREAAWQDVFHLHVHVVPRYAGDGLVPPWQGSHPSQEELARVHATVTGVVSPGGLTG
jgi:histidine triad (HIT) family protein